MARRIVFVALYYKKKTLQASFSFIVFLHRDKTQQEKSTKSFLIPLFPHTYSLHMWPRAWVCERDVQVCVHTWVYQNPGLLTGPGLTFQSCLLRRWQGVCNHHLSKVQTDYYFLHTHTHTHTHFYNQCGWPDFPHHYPGRQEIEKSHQYHIFLLWWMANGGSVVRFLFFPSNSEQGWEPTLHSITVSYPHHPQQPAPRMNNFCMWDSGNNRWMNHRRVNVICHCTGSGRPRVMDETWGQICDREIQPERDGKGGGMDGGERESVLMIWSYVHSRAQMWLRQWYDGWCQCRA